METPRVQRRTANRIASSDPAGLLYGAIVSAAVLATAGGHEESAGKVIVAWLFVLATYWLAHVYVHAMAKPFGGDLEPLRRRLLAGAGAESAVLLGGVPAMAVFLVWKLFGAETSNAAQFALYFTVGLLFALGYLGARHAGHSVPTASREAVGASLFGVLMIVAKSLLH